MAYGGLEIEGGRNLRRTLKQAGKNLDDLKAIHREVGDIVVGRATGWAPRVSGRLAGSIRAGATRRAAVIRAGNNRKSASGVPYAAPIHWGWPRRGISANPFLSYSAQATESTWVGVYFDYVEDTLDDVKGI